MKEFKRLQSSPKYEVECSKCGYTFFAQKLMKDALGISCLPTCGDCGAYVVEIKKVETGDTYQDMLNRQKERKQVRMDKPFNERLNEALMNFLDNADNFRKEEI